MDARPELSRLSHAEKAELIRMQRNEINGTGGDKSGRHGTGQLKTIGVTTQVSRFRLYSEDMVNTHLWSINTGWGVL